MALQNCTRDRAFVSALKETTLKFHEIPAGGLDFDFSQESGELNSALFDILGDYPVYRAQLHVKPVNDLVQLNGTLSGEFRHICSRCADEFSAPFSKSFTAAYYSSEDNIKSFSNEDLTDLDGSFDLEFLEDDLINLGNVVHEHMALEIPFQPLCSEDCKGLCTQCGTNLNMSQCSCVAKASEKRPSPFEKLKILKGE